VIAPSESDEFWYLCVPNDQITNLESCGNTTFRETEIATTANGSTGSITVDSNRNFIISDSVHTLEGRVVATVRESVNFKSKHNFNVNANTDIQDAVRISTVESTTTTGEGLLTTTGSKVHFLSTYCRLFVCG
jgi:hypothetical protein